MECGVKLVVRSSVRRPSVLRPLVPCRGHVAGRIALQHDVVFLFFLSLSLSLCRPFWSRAAERNEDTQNEERQPEIRMK